MIIHLSDNWRPDAVKLFHPGDYWIPRDMSEELARQALDAGAATLVEGKTPDVKAPAPENKVPVAPKARSKGKE